MVDNAPLLEPPERPEPFRLDKPTYNLIYLPLGTGYWALLNNLSSRKGLFDCDRDYEREPLVIALGHLWRVFREIGQALGADRIFEDYLDQATDDPTCTAAKLGGLVLDMNNETLRIPTDQTDYVVHELHKKICHGREVLIYQMAGLDRDQRSGHLVRAIGYIRLAEQALALDRCDRHHIDPADDIRAFAKLVAEADLEVCRVATTLGDQLIQQAEQQKEARPAGGQGQRPDSGEPT